MCTVVSFNLFTVIVDELHAHTVSMETEGKPSFCIEAGLFGLAADWVHLDGMDSAEASKVEEELLQEWKETKERFSAELDNIIEYCKRVHTQDWKSWVTAEIFYNCCLSLDCGEIPSDCVEAVNTILSAILAERLVQAQS